jgi:hypothetical protein
MLKTTPEEEIFEELSIFGVVWGLLELKLSAMSHILSKFLWVTMTELLNWCIDFTLFNFSVLIILVACTQSLPGKLSFK